MLNIENCIQCNQRTGSYEAISVSGVVDELIERLHILTIMETGDILKYENGVYVGNGLQLISQVLAHDLSKLVSYKGKPMYNKMVKLEIIDLIKDRTLVSVKDFDTDLDTINMNNCIYNWRTGESIPHNPMYLSVIQVPIDYDPNATCEKIEEILRDIIQPEDYIKMLEFIAFLYYRNYSVQKAFILYGPGGTGKSAFLNMLDKMIGANNCSAVPFDEIDQLFARVNLCGKLMNKGGELDNQAVKRTLIFKSLTSGFDPIEARHLYKESFRFVNFAKLIWATNSIPRVFDDTDGFYRRVEILLFLHKFKPEEYDQERMDAMVDPKQLSGLFNLCISKLEPLLERHDYTNASTVDGIREKYRAISDPIQSFADDRLVACPDGRISCDELYELYEAYCQNFKVKPIHKNQFDITIPSKIRSMRQDRMAFGRKRSVCCWVGVRVI